MNNWHIKIADCTEAQKERLKQVYGVEILRYGYYGRDENNIAAYNFDIGELITPDEAFERLGLDEDVLCLKGRIAGLEHAIGCRKEDLFNAEKKIKELECQKNALQQSYDLIEDELGHAEKINYKLEQQLAAKSYDYPIDWSVLPQECCHIGQHKKGGATVSQFALFSREEWPGVQKHYHLIATRPKPKYTPEQIEAAKAYDEWLDLNSGEFESDCFEAWLKEVGND